MDKDFQRFVTPFQLSGDEKKTGTIIENPRLELRLDTIVLAVPE